MVTYLLNAVRHYHGRVKAYTALHTLINKCFQGNIENLDNWLLNDNTYETPFKAYKGLKNE